jgi:hypothetical protein
MYRLSCNSNHPPHPPPSTLMSLYTQVFGMFVTTVSLEGSRLLVRQLGYEPRQLGMRDIPYLNCRPPIKVGLSQRDELCSSSAWSTLEYEEPYTTRNHSLQEVQIPIRPININNELFLKCASLIESLSHSTFSALIPSWS